MQISPQVKQLLSYYEADTPGTRTNLAQLLTHGRLANTGRLLIYPVDQGFEHGPDRAFAPNPQAYDPHYHYQMAIDAGVSAFAAPLGLLEAGANTFAGQVPTILKLNSSNSLAPGNDQAITASVDDALRLGCRAIGFTIYPGTQDSLGMFEEIQHIANEAKSCGLVVVIWSYPRGSISKRGETAINVVSYGAHMAALLGAHIIKVKLPSSYLEEDVTASFYENNNIEINSTTSRVKHIVQCCFAGRRIVVFSGGEAKETGDVLADARAIRDGGGHGSIIGRNVFQRPREQALAMIDDLIKIYQE